MNITDVVLTINSYKTLEKHLLSYIQKEKALYLKNYRHTTINKIVNVKIYSLEGGNGIYIKVKLETVHDFGGEVVVIDIPVLRFINFYNSQMEILS